MASTIDSRLITEAQLLDVVDEAWQRDVLPDDGERGGAGRAVGVPVATSATCR